MPIPEWLPNSLVFQNKSPKFKALVKYVLIAELEVMNANKMIGGFAELGKSLIRHEQEIFVNTSKISP